MSSLRTPTTATVVGAGLVGSMWATYLARRGVRVDVYERRPDLRRSAISAGRSINLALSTRGIHALRQIGLEGAILEHAVPMRGRMMHAVGGELTFQPYGRDESECIYSISRGGLNQALLTRAEAAGARIHFRHKAVGVDLRTRRCEFVDESSGAAVAVTPDLLFGTDGSGSAVRAAMARDPRFRQSESVLDYGYKEFHIPPTKDGGFQLEKNALHIWPRGSFMLIALPNADGSFTCTLFLPFEDRAGDGNAFASLKTEGEVSAFFLRAFPDVVPLLSNVVETYFSSPTGQMVTVKSAPWSLEARTLVLGDAAHAIVPFFGQGMNCGFEDCSLLDAFLDAHPEDGFERFAEFAEHRKPDADAIADLAVDNFIEMRDKVGNARFLLEKAVEKVLQKELPGEYLSRYALVTFSRAPYRVAKAAGEASDRILAELCEGLTRPESVDLERARVLIARELSPILKEAKAWI